MSLECYVGPEGNLLETHAEARRAAAAAPADPHERGAGRHQEPEPSRLEIADDRHHVRRATRRPGALQPRDRSHLRRSGARDRRGLQHGRALGPRHRPGPRARERAARVRRRASPSREPREAHAHRHHARDRRGARGSSPLPARRLRRGRHQPVSRVRGARRNRATTGCSTRDTDLVGDYRQAVAKGMLKVMAKMGISTLQSYKGGQIFEALGIADEVIERCFRGTVSRLQGVELRRARRGSAAPPRARLSARPDRPACRRCRTPASSIGAAPASATRGIRRRSSRCRSRRAAATRTRTSSSRPTSTRKRARPAHCAACSSSISRASPLPLDEVEPASEIVKRFCTGAMSFGSLSAEAHETLAIAMNRIGGKSNTGEGGEDPARFVPLPTGDSRRSAIKQIASGRFGVTIWYLANADELQIKMAQGAKPGEGGELPGKKVDDNIARIRYSTPGVGLDQPAAAPRHLLDRGSGAADPRSEELEPDGAHQREARVGGRRRHDRRGRREGARRSRADLGRQRRHGRFAAHEHQARGPAVGARHRRDAPDARHERPAQPRRAADRRRLEDRPRRRDRRAARRRGDGLLDGAADRARLHHDAQVSLEHLPGRRRDAGSRCCARSSRASPSTS